MIIRHNRCQRRSNGGEFAMPVSDDRGDDRDATDAERTPRAPRGFHEDALSDQNQGTVRARGMSRCGREGCASGRANQQQKISKSDPD